MLAFIASIGSFIPGLFGKDLSLKAAKIAGFAILALLLAATLSLGKCAYDASVVNNYEVKHDAQAAKQTLDADRAADAAMENKAAQFDETQAKLEQVTAEAAKADPVGAAKTVGPVTSSYYDELRKKEKRK